MIPVKLTIEGIYSYQGRQTIDFSNLTQAGLFGIFGATGSGKSSILEAISYALYGDIERLNRADKRAYNMMNLKSNRTYIEFDFYNYENELYRATRELKRNTKKFEEVRSPKVVVYRYEKDSWQPIEDTSIEKIIGLSYKNFKRTIIIPQGQFREFLELGITERTRMMQDIFQLQRYDLQENVSHLYKKDKSSLDQVNGRLQNYESVSKEEIEKKKTILREKEKTLKKVEKDFDSINRKYQKLEHLKTAFDRLKEKKRAFQKLEDKRDEMLSAEKEVKDYERIEKVFYQPLVDWEKTKNEHQIKKKREAEVEKEFLKYKNKLQADEEALEKIKPYFNQLEQKKEEAEDLRLITENLILSAEKKQGEKRLEKGRNLITIHDEKLLKIKSKIERYDKELTQKKAEKPEAKLLREVGQWFQEKKNLKRNKQQQNKKVSEKETELKTLIKELTEKDIQIDTFKKRLEKEEQEQKEKEQSFLQKKETLKVKEKLSEHAHDLKEGEACPLCGAEEHPHIVEIEDVSAQLEQLAYRLQKLDNQKDSLRKKAQYFYTKVELIENIKKDIHKENNQLKDIEHSLTHHLSSFSWKEFDPEEETTFYQKVEEVDKIEREISEKEKQLKNERKEEEKTTKKIAECQELLNKLLQEDNSLQIKIDSNKAHLKQLDPADYQAETVENLKKQRANLKLKNEQIEKQHQLLQDSIHQLHPKIASQKTHLENLDEQIEEIISQGKELRRKIDAAILKEEAGSVEEVSAILSKKIDIAAERKKIERFKIDFEKLKSSIDELEENLEENAFSETLFRQEAQKWKACKHKLQEINDDVVEWRKSIRELEKHLKEKEVLQEQQNKLQKRVENLKTMFGLFKAKGFVQYVSSLYLSQLCHQANVRFQRMTRNQLSLRLNKDNEFEIIDYLNEGKSRSVKTLSGGQSFQVSLSLALALAENVQTHAKAEKKFFFIDEGFGTQDADAIAIIFETLLNLNKENKIVGIISHVEALKDRISQSLMVEKDAENGSRIYVK